MIYSHVTVNDGFPPRRRRSLLGVYGEKYKFWRTIAKYYYEYNDYFEVIVLRVDCISFGYRTYSYGYFDN